MQTVNTMPFSSVDFGSIQFSQLTDALNPMRDAACAIDYIIIYQNLTK